MKFTYSDVDFNIENFDESYQEGPAYRTIININLSDTTQFDTLIDLLRTNSSGDIKITINDEVETYSGYTFSRANKNYYCDPDGVISRNASVAFVK